MKSYYEFHEQAYQQLKAKGYIGWDKAKVLSELGDKQSKQFLTESIIKFVGATAGKTALDVGCGSGVTAFLLDDLGYQVTGVDISNTAIDMANELASVQGKKIKFYADDILDPKRLENSFDVIYDSHCLHCIVFDEDRVKFFRTVKNKLSSGGIFILDTMVFSPEMDLVGDIKALRFDVDYILWHKTEASDTRGVSNHDKQSWCAQRRVYPAEKIIAEIIASEFTILTQKIDTQQQRPSMLRLILK